MAKERFSRITGGALRGRTVKAPSGEVTHPMGSRERLALFNALSARLELEGAEVLDAYAGTGALGIEALSRGAKAATFIEKDARVCANLKANLASFQLKNATVLCQNVVNFTTDKRFDLIFIDPPYDHFYPEEFSQLGQFLKKTGYIVISHPRGEVVSLPGFEVVSSKKYAAAQITTLHFCDFVV